jgi:hypothetical protein
MRWLSVPPRSAFPINEVTSALDAAAGNTSLGKQMGHGTRDKAKRKESKHKNANKSEIGTFVQKGKAEYTSQFTIPT